MRLKITSTVLLLGWLCACIGEDRSSERAPSEPSGRRGTLRFEESIDTDLDLQAMLAPVPEYEGRGRNLFVFGPVRQETSPDAPTTTSPLALNTRSTTPRTSSTGTPAHVDVKYAGFVERTERTGDRSKYAILLDGKDIFALAEGDTLANRFTVVKIGLESVTVSAKGSSTTQRIPLQSN